MHNTQGVVGRAGPVDQGSDRPEGGEVEGQEEEGCSEAFPRQDLAFHGPERHLHAVVSGGLAVTILIDWCLYRCCCLCCTQVVSDGIFNGSFA